MEIQSKLTIEFKQIKVELTFEEALSLRDELNKFIGQPSTIIYPSYPTLQPVNPWAPLIYCSNGDSYETK